MKKDNVQQEYPVPDLEEFVDQHTKGVLNESQVQSLEDVAEIIENDIENTFEEDTNQEEGKCVLEQEQTPIDVHEERSEIPMLDKLRVDNTQSSK